MNCKKILVPTDFSSASKAALEYATAIARQNDATVLIAHVEEPPAAAMMAEQFATPLYPNPEIARQLEAVIPVDDQVQFQHRLLRGVAIEDIPRLAEDEHVDLIVMGSHGRRGFSRLLMGSVAEVVMRYAKCPVLVVKEPAGASQDEIPPSSHPKFAKT